MERRNHFHVYSLREILIQVYLNNRIWVDFDRSVSPIKFFVPVHNFYSAFGVLSFVRRIFVLFACSAGKGAMERQYKRNIIAKIAET